MAIATSVNFTNLSGQHIFIAYMFRDFACSAAGGVCSDAPWRVAGWVSLANGETQYRDNPTSNRWFYYYAEGANGPPWSGNNIVTVSKAHFEHCQCVDLAGGYAVGMADLDLAVWGGVTFYP